MRLRDGQPLRMLEDVRSAPTTLDAVARLAAAMLRAAYGLDAPPVGELSRHDIRAHEAVMRLLGELRGWSELDGPLSPEELVAALERAEVRRSSATEPGRVAVLDLLRARTRRFEIVFLLGLEEGRLPRRGHESPFLADDARRELDERSRSRLTRPDQVARDRLGTATRTRAARVRPADAADASAGARRAADEDDVRRHRARALRRLLVDLVPRADDRSEDDGPGGRRAAARLDRAPGVVPFLLRTAEGARCGTRRSGAHRRRARLPPALPRRGGRRRAHGAHRAAAARVAARALARSRGVRARRRGGRDAARAAPLRGPVRLRARRAGAAARTRAGGAADAVGEDRPHRRRPVQRARDRAGLQGRKARAFGGADRVRAEAADPALHARAARPRRNRASRRHLPAALGRPQGARPVARRCARRRRARLLEE